MQALTYSEVRNKLKSVLDIVNRDGETVIVTRKRGENVVILSLDDYNGMQETIHLLSSPKNAERLLRSIREVERGEAIERELVE